LFEETTWTFGANNKQGRTKNLAFPMCFFLPPFATTHRDLEKVRKPLRGNNMGLVQEYCQKIVFRPNQCFENTMLALHQALLLGTFTQVAPIRKYGTQAHTPSTYISNKATARSLSKCQASGTKNLNAAIGTL